MRGVEHGITDEGLHYDVLRSPDSSGPVVIAVYAKEGTHWTDEGVAALKGKEIGMRFRDQHLLLRIVNARINPITRRGIIHLRAARVTTAILSRRHQDLA